MEPNKQTSISATKPAPPEKIEVAVYLPDEEAQRFMVFQEHYEIFGIMYKAGVFDQKNATILLDFDRFGKISNIRRQDSLYSIRQLST